MRATALPVRRRWARPRPIFRWEEALAFAHEALSAPPRKPHIERVRPAGELVQEFVLPLHLCPTANTASRAGTAAQRGMLGRLKREAYEMMRTQNGGRVRSEPLPGRPHIVCVRFSSVAPDPLAGWQKSPVDRLRVGHNGLGYIANDRSVDIQLSAWWEPGPRGNGFVLTQVWTA